mmetsp:Transcript_10276/g.20038  ORF Transcript_10276/g.20038 Transcript_10276/m.20038 type:complete len:93 (-) Transcript_10276:392-670(-)
MALSLVTLMSASHPPFEDCGALVIFLVEAIVEECTCSAAHSLSHSVGCSAALLQLLSSLPLLLEGSQLRTPSESLQLIQFGQISSLEEKEFD